MKIRELAALARLAVAPEEEERMQAEIASLIGFASQLCAAGVEDVPPTMHILPVENVLREDVPGAPMEREALLQGAPSHAQGCITVPKALE